MQETTLESSWITDNTITLSDGRLLGYARYGDLEGRPLLHFHSWPGSRLEARMVADAATRAGVHLIGVDRPGMGRSDFKMSRTILDWADDVGELADALGLQRFAIPGISIGGAYACACAKAIPYRITALSIISGLGSFDTGTTGMKWSNRLIFFIARRLPWLMRPFLWASIGRISENEEKIGRVLLRMVGQLPEADQKLYLNPRIRQQLAASTKEAFRQGTRGLAYESRLITQPWGFELEEIACEDLYLWHGVQDADIPVAMARSVANAIPGCTAKFYPEDGQFRFLMPNRRRFGKRGTFGVPIDADFYDPRQGGLRFRYTPMSTPSRVCCPNATPRVQNSRWVKKEPTQACLAFWIVLFYP